MAKETQKNNQAGERTGKRGSGDISIPATRHVGPTLESDPEYVEVEGAGDQIPEQLISQGIGTDPENVRDIVSRGTESDVRPQQDAGLVPDEPLKTRLPGDTSSDPHADLGLDNATTLQREPDAKRNAA